MDKKAKDLSLLLLYLTGWEEESKREPGQKIFRSWKGYNFEILNHLERENMILQFNNAKSVYLTKEGIDKAESLKQKFL